MKDRTLPSVGFIGIGLMGHGMAVNIQESGYALHVVGHRRRERIDALLRAGAEEAPTPAALASRSEIVFICVNGTPEVEDIMLGEDGIVRGGRPGLIVVDASTSDPNSTRWLASLLQEHGMAMADAPVTRSPVEAQAGRLVSLVGAAADTFEAITPFLETYSEQIVHFGPVGAGHTAKLVNNFVTCGQAALIAEAFAACAHGNVDMRRMLEVMSVGAANSGTLQKMVPKMLDGDLSGHQFAIGNAYKDIEYFRRIAQAGGLNSTVSDAVYQTYNQAVNLGFGDQLMASLFEVQERLSNISVVPKDKRRKAS